MIIVEVGHIEQVDQLQAGATVGRESPKFPIAVQDQPAAVEGPVWRFDDHLVGAEYLNRRRSSRGADHDLRDLMR